MLSISEGLYFYKTQTGFVHECVCAQSCQTLCDPMDSSPQNSSVYGKDTGVGCHFLFQGILPIQGLNPHLLHPLHWQTDCLPLCHLR